MKRRWFSLVVRLLPAAMLAVGLFGGSAEAVLKDFGSLTFAGFPAWFRDNTGTAIQQCLSKAVSPVSGLELCAILPFPDTVPPFDPALPLSFPPNPPTNYNWPLESFYFSAVAPKTFQFAQPNSKVLVETALEGTFATLDPIPGAQIAFSRIRINLLSVPNGKYTVTHPFGVDVLNVSNGTTKMTRDIGASGTPFVAALPGDVGPFLTWTPDAALIAAGKQNANGTISALNPASGATDIFLGDPNVDHAFTGSPFGTNYFRIDGPVGSNIGGPGVDFIQTSLATIEGQLYVLPIPSPLAVQRASYTRNDVNAEIDVFATSAILTNQNTPSSLTATLGTLPPVQMAGDSAGKFFGHLASDTPADLPATITVTNTADVPPTTVVADLVDQVVIGSAVYDAAKKQLTVQATSTDRLLKPALVVTDLGTIDPITGTLVVTGLTVPPPSVTVVSAARGTVTAPVQMRWNTAPVAADDAAEVAPDATVIIPVLINDADPDGTVDPATVTILTAPGTGSAVVNPDGTISYTAGATPGVVIFGYTVRDNAGGISNEARVAVTVVSNNAAPVAVDDIAVTTGGKNIVIPVVTNDTDADGVVNPTTIAIVSLPAGGTATPRLDGTVLYEPTPGFSGSDTFSYTIRDNLGALSNAGVVNVTVLPPNLPPTAANDAVSTNKNTVIVIPVLANDLDSDGSIDPTSVTVTAAAAHGTATAGAGGAVTYTPAADYVGTDSFTYTVRDNLGAVSNTATVSVTVIDPNILPAAVNDAAVTIRNAAVTVNVVANDTDADGTINPATVAVVVPSPNGAAVANGNGTITFTPAAGFTGTATFSYTVNDNVGGVSNRATVTVTVDAPPVAANDTGTMSKGGTLNLNVLANDTDADGTVNPATLTIVTPPVNGSATVSNGVVTYNPGATFAGTVTFTYTVRDNLNAVSNVATVTITVNDVNLAPVAANDSASLVSGNSVTVNVLANDSDADGTLATGSVRIGTLPANGSVVVNPSGTVTYTPNTGFVGTNTFTYTVLDNLGAASNTATVTVTVTAPLTETLRVTRAQFTQSGRSWRVEGSTTARITGEAIDIYVGSTVAGGTFLGRVPVNTNGVWIFQNTNSVVGPDGSGTVSIRSSNGTLLQGVAVLVR